MCELEDVLNDVSRDISSSLGLSLQTIQLSNQFKLMISRCYPHLKLIILNRHFCDNVEPGVLYDIIIRDIEYSDDKSNGYKFTPLFSADDLEKMYWDEGMSQLDIANHFGVSQITVGKWMLKFNVDIRSRWKGGISGGKYCYKFNNKFREAVRERDDYTCQLCGCGQKLNNDRLSVHHVHYDKENCHPDVVALCYSCHGKVNSNRDYWEKYFENQLIDRGLYCWSLSNIA